MSSHEAPTLVLDDPEQDQPDLAQPPEEQPTAVLPPAEGEEGRRPELSQEELRQRLGSIAVADEHGAVPFRATKREERWRRENPYYGWPYFKRLSPGHPHRHMINAVNPKVDAAVKARAAGFHYGDHNVAVNNTAGAIRSLAVKLHANEYHATADVIHEGKIDHTGHRRTGYGTNQFRRPFARIHQALGRMRSPEHQVSDERKLALREIGKLQNLDIHMAEVDALDESGHFAEVLRSGSPPALRRELGDLSAQGVIPETNPLHARWSEVMDPRNVQKFRQYIIKTSDQKIHGETPAAATLHMSAVGIMGGMRPRAVADYLGVTYEQWDEQRYGFPSDGKDPDAEAKQHAVPKEVVDQVCLLMKLDSRLIGGTVKGADGEERPRTALDALIEVGAAQPMTEPRRSTDPESPLSKGPMERVEDETTERARLELEEQDRNAEHVRMLSMQYGANLEELNRRLAGLDPEDDDDKEEYTMLAKQKAKIIARLKQHNIPVPDDQDKPSSDS